MECYLTLEIRSEKNFAVLKSVLEGMRDYDVPKCKELLAGLDPKTAEHLQEMVEDYDDYIEGIESFSADESNSSLTADMVTGGEGSAYAEDLLRLFGPYADSAKCSFEHDDEMDEDGDTMYTYANGQVVGSQEQPARLTNGLVPTMLSQNL